jgi:hypothetical protein
VGILVIAQTALAAGAEEIMCPGGASLKQAMTPYEALEKERAKIERLLSSAEGAVQMFQGQKADYLRGQRIWGVFQATDDSVALISMAIDTVKTAADLIRDTGADLDPTRVTKGISLVSSAIQGLIEKGRGQKSDCTLGGSPGEEKLRDFVVKPIPVAGTIKTLGTNVCRTAERQIQRADLVEAHRKVMGTLDREVSKWSEAARSLRTRLAGIESKRRGLERQCVAFTEKQRKPVDPRMVEFALSDAERSREISAHRSDAEFQRLANSESAFEQAMQQVQRSPAQTLLVQTSRPAASTKSHEPNCMTLQEAWAACRVACPPDAPRPEDGCTDLNCFTQLDRARSRCFDNHR